MLNLEVSIQLISLASRDSISGYVVKFQFEVSIQLISLASRDSFIAVGIEVELEEFPFN